jgi:hypothetical protein
MRTRMTFAVVFLGFMANLCWGQESARLGQMSGLPARPSGETPWRGLALSIAVQGAASGFDAWSSWNRPERNRILADNGRFTSVSAARKAGLLAGVSVIEVLVVKKWGRKHPWIAKACQIGNFTSAGMMISAGARNIGLR